MKLVNEFLVLSWKNGLLYWRHKGMFALHFAFAVISLLLMKYVSRDLSATPLGAGEPSKYLDTISSSSAGSQRSVVSPDILEAAVERLDQMLKTLQKSWNIKSKQGDGQTTAEGPRDRLEDLDDGIRFDPGYFDWPALLRNSTGFFDFHPFNNFDQENSTSHDSRSSAKRDSSLNETQDSSPCETTMTQETSWFCSKAAEAFPNQTLAFVAPHVSPIHSEKCFTYIVCDGHGGAQEKHLPARPAMALTDEQLDALKEMSNKVQFAVDVIHAKKMVHYGEKLHAELKRAQRSSKSPTDQDSAEVHLLSTSTPPPSAAASTSSSTRGLKDVNPTTDFRHREIFVFVIVCIHIFYIPLFLHPVALEKKLGIKDIFRAMGVSRVIYWLSWIVVDFAMMAIMTLIIMGSLYIPIFPNEPANHAFSNQPAYLICSLLLLHGIEIIVFTIFVNNACPNASFGVTVGLLFRLLIASIVSEMAVYGRLFDHQIYAFLPGAPLFVILESRGRSVRSIWHGNAVQMAFIGITAYIVLFALLAWYVAHLVPGKFGTKDSPFFLFNWRYWAMRGHWKPSVIKNQEDENMRFLQTLATSSVAGDASTAEIRGGSRIRPTDVARPPEVAVTVENLLRSRAFHGPDTRKVRSRNTSSLRGITFVALANQITVVLGLNHSGKTTLMHTLAGFCQPSFGTVRVYKAARERPIGICPYADYLYPELTPKEHLQLYGSLRDSDWDAVRDETTVLLDIVHIIHRGHDQCRMLSYAVRRIVSLLAAVVGRPRLILIDQPSEGTDKHTQNALWTLLKVLKEEKTIIFSSQSAKEAEILGDRIVLIHRGETIVSGTMEKIERIMNPGDPAFLIVKPLPGIPATEVDGRIFDAFPLKSLLLQRLTKDEIIYQYNPKDAAEIIVDSFLRDKDNLGIESVKLVTEPPDDAIDAGLYDATAFLLHDIDHSFVRRAHARRHRGSDGKRALKWTRAPALSSSNTTTSITSNVQQPQQQQQERPKEFESGTTCTHFKVELWKKSLVGLRRSWLWIFQLAMIVGATIAIILMANSLASDFATRYRSRIIGRSSNAYTGTEDPAYQLVSSESPYMEKRSIGESGPCPKGEKPSHTRQKRSANSTRVLPEGAISSWYTFQITRLVLPICLLVCSFCWGPTDERVRQMKQLQRIASLRPVIYWCSHFLVDFSVYTLAVILMTVVVVSLDTLAGPGILTPYWGIFFVVFIVFGITGILMAYCISFMSDGRAYSIAVLMVLVIVGDILYYVGEIIRLHFARARVEWFNKVLSILPTFGVLRAVDSLARNAFLWQVVRPIVNNQTGILRKTAFSSSDYPTAEEALEFSSCTDSPDYFSKTRTGAHIPVGRLSNTQRSSMAAMMAWENNVAPYLLILFIDAVLLLLVLVFFEVFGNFGQFTFGTKQYVRNYEASVTGRVSDDDVADEGDRIDELVASKKVHEDHLVMWGVFKRFKRKLPIRGISFGVHYGECFGILGVNGAGKTLLFKLVSGLISPSRGSIWIEGKKLTRNNYEALKHVGYCPQFDGFIHLLTGRETLTLMARLKGIPEKDLKARVNAVLSLTNMGNEADDLCQRYSEGTHRKLSTGIAILGNPRLLILDQPTASLDFDTKKKIWTWLLKGLDDGRHTILMTTNCLDEAQLLCDRASILVNGQLKCIGSPRYLTKKFCPGIKLTSPYSLEIGMDEFQAARKAIIEALGQNVILEEATQLGNFVLRLNSDLISLEEVERKMQDLVANYDFILGYSCSTATFADVFLRFAKLSEPLEDEIPICPNCIC